eukprot:GHVH01012958.1.p1 GENE.GHVH01012958.1~~GHVH01012958.1.p1  ORF type:complete len:114 (+),score=11.79 GHVH01012958.1:623-964(+)
MSSRSFVIDTKLSLKKLQGECAREFLRSTGASPTTQAKVSPITALSDPTVSAVSDKNTAMTVSFANISEQLDSNKRTMETIEQKLLTLLGTRPITVNYPDLVKGLVGSGYPMT